MAWTQERARYSALRRYRPETDASVQDAKRELRAARLEDYITKTLAAAPPLTDEQRTRLAVLLRGPSARPEFPPATLPVGNAATGVGAA